MLRDEIFEIIYYLTHEDSNGYEISSIQYSDKYLNQILDLMMDAAVAQCVSQANALPPDASDEYYKGYKDAIAECTKAIRLLKVEK